MISDSRKGITITYNYLDLPDTIKQGTSKLVFTYDAAGNKLYKQLVSGGNVTSQRHYIDNYLELTASSSVAYDGQVESVAMDEGRIVNVGSGNYQNEYFLQDHLGNNRVTFRPNADGTLNLTQVQNYYPFGGDMGDATMNYTASPQNLYKYSGKEWQPELNLNTYDFGARHYDPVLARWTAVDPLAEEYNDLSPYNYVENNPMNVIDADGMGTTGCYNWGGSGGWGSGSLGFAGDLGGALGNGAWGVIQASKAFSYKAPTTQNFSGMNKVQGNSASAGAGGHGNGAAHNNNGFRWPTWTYDVPVFGRGAFRSGNELAEGNYVASALDFTTGVAELWTLMESKAIEATNTLTNAFSRQTTTKIVSAGVWDDIVATQGVYPGSILPKSFELTVENGTKVWVHGNATEHIAEYIGMVSEHLPPDKVRLVTQQLLKSLQSAVNAATENGVVYEKMINIGGWQLKFAAPRAAGLLPVLKHAAPF